MLTATPTHWKSLSATDPEFYELCRQRIVEEYEDLYGEDPEDAPAELYVDFGVRDAMLALDQVDDEAGHLFGWGACGYLAFELHRLTGLPLALFTSTSPKTDPSIGWSGHAAVALPDGSFLDIEGVVTAAEINERYGFSERIEPTFPDRTEYCRTMFPNGDTAELNPYRDLDPLEIRLLRHFAELVARRSGIELAS